MSKELKRRGILASSLEKKQIERIAKTAKDGDLYKALHHVGDDDLKVLIEDVLKQTLDVKTFKKVVAVFDWATRTWL